MRNIITITNLKTGESNTLELKWISEMVEADIKRDVKAGIIKVTGKVGQI